MSVRGAGSQRHSHHDSPAGREMVIQSCGALRPDGAITEGTFGAVSGAAWGRDAHTPGRRDGANAGMPRPDGGGGDTRDAVGPDPGAADGLPQKQHIPAPHALPMVRLVGPSPTVYILHLKGSIGRIRPDAKDAHAYKAPCGWMYGSTQYFRLSEPPHPFSGGGAIGAPKRHVCTSRTKIPWTSSHLQVRPRRTTLAAPKTTAKCFRVCSGRPAEARLMTRHV